MIFLDLHFSDFYLNNFILHLRFWIFTVNRSQEIAAISAAWLKILVLQTRAFPQL